MFVKRIAGEGLKDGTAVHGFAVLPCGHAGLLDLHE
jgi:hypothetical protein